MEDNKEPEIVNDNVQKKYNSVGIVSFVFSLVGIIVAGLPCGIVATITGIIGIATFKPDKEKGKWMAITGLVIGIIEIIVMVMYLMGVMEDVIS